MSEEEHYPPDHNDKEHFKALLVWLYETVIADGGDGDAIWLCRNFSIKDLFPIVQEINNILNAGYKGHQWEVHLQDEGRTIHWHRQQEGIYITSTEEMFNSMPNWYTVKIRY